jgi:heptosyltransferase-2
MRGLAGAYDIGFVVLGGCDVAGDAKTLRALLGSGDHPSAVLDLCGRTTLHQTAAVLEQVDVFVGNDSGITHLAASLDVPIIGIWCHPKGASETNEHSPTRFGPVSTNCAILRPAVPAAPSCSDGCVVADYPHCIVGVPARAVIEGVGSFLAGAGSARAANADAPSDSGATKQLSAVRDSRV